MRKAARSFARFWGDESGATAAEYVMILAIVGTALAVAIILLSGAIATGINETAICIDTKGMSCSAPSPPRPPAAASFPSPVPARGTILTA